MKHIKSFELIVEGVEVKTNRYQRAHGKKPKGFGQWAFYFNDRGGDPIFTPTSMNYADAVKWAKGEAKKAGKTEIYVGESVNEGEILELNEFFEVIYSDGISQKKDFKSKSKAIEFMRDEISSNKKLKNIAVYKGGSGFYSTSQTDRVISFWGDGSYLDNLSKKDKDLASKKMNEGKLDEYANIDLGEDLQAALDMIEAKIELIKSKTSDKDWIKALDVIERAYDKFFDTVAKYTTKLGVVPLDEAYSNEERMELAKKGLALDDGSFPIKDLADLKNAIQAYGRAKDQSKAAKFIAKRAKALGAEDLIPNTEDFQKSLKESLSYSNLFVYGNEIKDEKDLISVLNTFDNFAEMSDDRKKGDKMYSAVRMIKQFADKNKIKLSKLRNKLNDKGQTALKRYLL